MLEYATGLITSLHYHGTGSVAKKDARIKIFPIDKATEDLGAVDQDIAVDTGREEPMRCHQGVDKIGVTSRQGKGACACGSQLNLRMTGDRRH